MPKVEGIVSIGAFFCVIRTKSSDVLTMPSNALNIFVTLLNAHVIDNVADLLFIFHAAYKQDILCFHDD